MSTPNAIITVMLFVIGLYWFGVLIDTVLECWKRGRS
jgi:hypothetical protein